MGKRLDGSSLFSGINAGLTNSFSLLSSQYSDGLTLENCTLINTPLAFEYSTGIDAQVNGKIESVKNPCGGKIKCDGIGTLILNPKRCDVNATIIDCKEIEKTFSEDPNPNENCF